MANHDAIVGIIRVPGLGWPVKCPSCGNLGYRKDRASAQKLATSHRRNK